MKCLLLTIDALEEDVEDAVAWYGELALVKEAVLDPLLVVLVRVEVVILQIVEEPRSDRSDPFDIVDSRTELLLAVLDSILQVLQCEHKLKQGVSLELETGGVLGALGHIVSLVENNDAISVVERIVGAHRLI